MQYIADRHTGEGISKMEKGFEEIVQNVPERDKEIRYIKS